jgi:predicted nucleic acid-binding protein
MRAVFADTFYFLALLDSREARHSAAVAAACIREALTGDRHFEQAGLVALLK